MKILVVGDIHTKTYLLEQADRAAGILNPEMIVAVGDLLDEWNITGEKDLHAFETILHWTRARGDVKLLIGNHDMPYYSESGMTFYCGFHESIATDVRHLITENIDLFDVGYAVDGWLFTHAGVCSQWWHMAGECAQNPCNAGKVAERLNEMLHQGRGRKQLELCGTGRGGISKYPGPLWSDMRELLADYLPGINQIIGHTPLKTVQVFEQRNGEVLAFCDTSSRYPDLSCFGDESMLLLDTERSELFSVDTEGNATVLWESTDHLR